MIGPEEENLNVCAPAVQGKDQTQKQESVLHAPRGIMGTAKSAYHALAEQSPMTTKSVTEIQNAQSVAPERSPTTISRCVSIVRWENILLQLASLRVRIARLANMAVASDIL